MRRKRTTHARDPLSAKPRARAGGACQQGVCLADRRYHRGSAWPTDGVCRQVAVEVSRIVGNRRRVTRRPPTFTEPAFGHVRSPAAFAPDVALRDRGFQNPRRAWCQHQRGSKLFTNVTRSAAGARQRSRSTWRTHDRSVSAVNVPSGCGVPAKLKTRIRRGHRPCPSPRPPYRRRSRAHGRHPERRR